MGIRRIKQTKNDLSIVGKFSTRTKSKTRKPVIEDKIKDLKKY